MNRTQVVLVDEQDREIGMIDKLEAHQKGLLHRAFSVLVFNSQGSLLLQKRASHKYHTPGLWTNTCCSHPQPGEPVEIAAARRLMEEMGISCELKRIYSFTYKATFENGLIEHELDHVFVGVSDDIPQINKDEVEDFRYSSIEDVTADIHTSPEAYTYWFKRIVNDSGKRFLEFI